MRAGGRTGLVAVVGVLAVSVATLGAGGPARAAGDGGAQYQQSDYADGQAMYVLPPGENGLVNATDALQFEATGKRPANSDDQLAQYSNLLYGYHDLTNAKLIDVLQRRVVRREARRRHPHRDARATASRSTATSTTCPHIYGGTDHGAAFGAGYAQAEDRLFLMDVLRHYGEGTLASFLGASCEFEQMDHDQLLLSAYTPAQAQAQVDALPQEYGAAGRSAPRTMIESYVAGRERLHRGHPDRPEQAARRLRRRRPRPAAPAEVGRAATSSRSPA